jgi:phenylpropionate dioxygenase-like ring-hydroxylating dioxygenase large terminal subunit
MTTDFAEPAPPADPASRPELLVPLARARPSVVRLADAWFPLALSSELARKPLARCLQNTPLTLFRDGDGRAGALLDRCPHRNVPLSEGEVVGGELQCPYHGWRFDREGACRHVPSLVMCGPMRPSRAQQATAFPAIEQDGLVWVYATPGSMPSSRPRPLTRIAGPGVTTVTQWVEMRSTLYSALENALDVPHTQFLHRGLFRSASRGVTIEAHVRRTSEGVTAEYVGEPRPTGLVARLLSPSGGMVTHFDRFFLPSVAEVEYSIGTENHFLVSSVMTPVSDFVTHIFASVSFRVRGVPGHLLTPVLRPLALRVFEQDARMLARQTEVIQRFGGEQLASTDIDVLGKHIWRLLRGAERGERVGDAEERVELVV